MWFGVISLFPEMFSSITEYGITSQAIKKGLLSIETYNPRDFTHDKHRTVDDRPYGGGPGMLMMVQPLRDAITAAKQTVAARAQTSINSENVTVIYLSPQGRKLDQQGVIELAKMQNIIFICGRYEGIDERIIETEVDAEWSIGDFVTTGGEIPAITIIDAVSRFIPGVLGDFASAQEDSFANGLLDHPHYTRPEILDGKKVPAVLMSGHHKDIRTWRLKQSLGRTWLKRPELLEKLALTDEQEKLLSQFIAEYNDPIDHDLVNNTKN